MKSTAIALFISILFFTAACSKEVKKPSEDSLLAVEALSLIESIKSAYVQKDLDAMKRYTTKEGFDAIRKEIKDFKSAEVSFTPKRVEIEGDTVRVSLTWDGRWEAEDRITVEHGLSVFVFAGHPLMLQAVELSNPFSLP